MYDLKAIGKRLEQFLNKKGIGVNELGRMSNTSGAQVSNIINGHNYGFDKLLKIINELPDLDFNWLVYGYEKGNVEGNLRGNLNSISEVILEREALSETIEHYSKIAKIKQLKDSVCDDENLIPFFNVDISAGGTIPLFNSQEYVPEFYISIPGYRGCICVPNYGKSMEYYIKNGDWLIIKPIKDKSFIEWGTAYVIITEDHRLTKYIKKGVDKNTYSLKSHNPEYDDIDLKISDILHLFHIKACIQPFSV